MVFSGGLLSQLDFLLQMFVRCNHHKQNYERSLFEGIIPTWLKIKKKTAFELISGNFYQQWNLVLYDTEKRLVDLWQEESEKSNRDSWNRYYLKDGSKISRLYI